MAPTLLSLRSATSAAEPAVSARTTGFSLCSLVNLRHCESACTWLSTVLRPASVAPFGAIRQWFTRWKCSPMIWRPASGSR